MAAVASRTPPPDLESLNARLARYRLPSLPRSLFQLANTALPLAALWAAMYWAALQDREWLALLLAPAAAGLLLRVFIIQHDCGHGAFLPSARANDALGAVLGVLTLSPYRYWRQTHAVHHAVSGNLDKRGVGDIDTLTVREYLSLPRWRRLRYRLYRSAPVLFLIGPLFHFFVYHRLPFIVPPSWRRERLSILGTNLALAALAAAAAWTVGLGSFLLVHLPALALASTAGVWLFYVQHQFERAYWRRDRDWDFTRAALEGSSYYRLPRVLQWLTGNIGFHHVHHLNSRIPNYFLERSMREVPALQSPPTLTLWASLRCASLALWDEEAGRLVGFSALRS